MREIVFDVNTNRHEWTTLALRLNNVYVHPNFIARQAEFMGVEARLYGLEHPSGAVLACPFFIRPLRGLPFISAAQAALSDILTPIYTGPLCTTDDSTVRAELGSVFQLKFAAYCCANGILAEFGHLNPWQACLEALVAQDVFLDREIVYVDLAAAENDLWQYSLTRECRKKIRQARDIPDLQVFSTSEPRFIADFTRIYNLTMDHHTAQQYYRYDEKYFQSLMEGMRAQSTLLLAAYHDRIIAGVILMSDQSQGYSYLSGIDRDYRHINGNNLLFYQAILWAKAHGCSRMVLGAGYRPDDGTFQFKKSFSPLRAQFRVYRHIYLHDEYAAVSRAWSEYYRHDQSTGGYFPAYRAVPG